MNSVQPYCRLAIMTMQTMPRTSWPHRVHPDAVARTSALADVVVIAIPGRVIVGGVEHASACPGKVETGFPMRTCANSKNLVRFPGAAAQDVQSKVEVVGHGFGNDAVLADRDVCDAGEPEPRRLAKERQPAAPRQPVHRPLDGEGEVPFFECAGPRKSCPHAFEVGGDGP